MNKKRALLFIILIISSLSNIYLSQILINTEPSIEVRNEKMKFMKDPLSNNNITYQFNKTGTYNSNSFFDKKEESSSILDNYAYLFDNTLKNYLEEIHTSQTTKNENLKIIIIFKESTNKNERLSIIDSIFENYQITNNYAIVSATSLIITSEELINKVDYINNNEFILKVFKSKKYKTPFLKNQYPKTASLDNWWIPAIGGEDLPYNGSGVKVAVIDSGISNHPDLNVINNLNFYGWDNMSYGDDYGHGTHVAGIIGSNGVISSGKYRGVAPGVSLINARAGGINDLYDSDILEAIEWCVIPEPYGAGANILSMSFGEVSLDPYDPITLALTNATNQGVICVASAGNSGPGYFSAESPACGIDVISVGAIDEDNELAPFSSRGPTDFYFGYPDIVAPGVNIISCEARGSVLSNQMRFTGDYVQYNNVGYIPMSGTSMSCPIVSGSCAILKQAYPDISPETARIALIEGAKNPSKIEDHNILKFGAGLINISASLEFLNEINNTLDDINNISKIFPDNLPFKPNDLLNYPGDNQDLNLMIISATNKTFEIEIPNNIHGIKFYSDNSTANFSSDPGVKFIDLEIEILMNCIPGTYEFDINLTYGGRIYDSAHILIQIRLPEYRILMESYHGLNDWYYDITFSQLGFYEAMSDIREKNISIDYLMEKWTPNYDKNYDNSILTLEKVFQYDLIVLQNPKLPYSSIELNALNQYFNNGGNILLLGTRYNDLCKESLNELLSNLGSGIEIESTNIMDLTFIGDFATELSIQNVSSFGGNSIFEGVNGFLWKYGTTFKTTGMADSLASLNGETVVSAYNGNSLGKGKIVAFGDLHWMYNEYENFEYFSDHKILLDNLMNYFLPHNTISINIRTDSERIYSSNLNLTIYLKNQTAHSPITQTDLDSLDITIKNELYTEKVYMNLTYSDYGIYFNNSYNLPNPSNITYIINVSSVIGGKNYNKVAKVIFVNRSKVPEITKLYTYWSWYYRDESVTIKSTLNMTNCEVDAYISLFPDSYLNNMMTNNITLPLNPTGKDYVNNFALSYSYPSGYGGYYVIPQSNYSYINPYSPRKLFDIYNSRPFIDWWDSKFESIYFANIYYDYYYLYSTANKNLDFVVGVDDYEDSGNQLTIFVDLFICNYYDGWFFLILPDALTKSNLNYVASTSKYEGSLTIPQTMKYDTLTGTKSISTSTNFHQGGCYIAMLLVTVYDFEGLNDYFFILIDIVEEEEIDDAKQTKLEDYISQLIIIQVVAWLGVASIIIISLIRIASVGKTKKPKDVNHYNKEVKKDSQTKDSTKEPPKNQTTKYCPHCGALQKLQTNSCNKCGKDLYDNTK